MITLLFLAWRNFIRNLVRYRVVLVALVVVSALFTMVLGTVVGLSESVRQKATRYFAGDLVVVGFSGKGESLIDEPEIALEALGNLKDNGVSVKASSKRSTYYDTENTQLFFAGYWTPQRRLVGVEWALERPVLSEFAFVSGNVPQDGDTEGALISSATAEELGIAVGDRMIVSIITDRGRNNTTSLVVTGVYAESSFFGYTTYLHRETLNRLKEADADQINEAGAYLENPVRDQERAAALVIERLGQHVPTFGVIDTRRSFELAADQTRDSIHYGVVTIGAQLAQIQDLLGAIGLIAGTVIILFLLITIVGVSNTYSMIVWERIPEIGTLRAMGQQRHRTILVFIFEAVFLGLFGVVAGAAIGLVGLSTIQEFVRLPENAATSLFLIKGRLTWHVPNWGLGIVVLLSVGATVAGCFRSALRAGKLDPVQALRHAK